MSCPPVRRATTSACTPSSRLVRSSSSRISVALPGVHDPAAGDHDRAVGEPAHDLEVLLDEQDRHDLRRLEERVGDLGHDLRREALGRLVDEQQPVVVEQRPRHRDHLLLAAGQRAGHLVAALHEVGEELGDELAARVALPLGEREVLGDGELGEDLAVLGHVADAALHDPVGRQPVDPLARERAPRRVRWMRPRMPRSVEVFPTPLRPSTAVIPVAGTSKVTSSTTCCPAIEARSPRTSRIGAGAHAAVPR